jgi:hypothetical protein
MNKIQFKSRKEVTEFLKNKGIDTSNWSEEKWLRINKGQAEIHMMALAEAMWDAYNESTPKELQAGEWHIPFNSNIDEYKIMSVVDVAGSDVSPIELNQIYPNIITDAKIKIATAMCARVSYTVVGEEGKEPNYENDIKLHDRLAKSGHWSPFEHCARAMTNKEYDTHLSGVISDRRHSKDLTREEASNVCGWSGNFRGFIQYRKMFNNENIK